MTTVLYAARPAAVGTFSFYRNLRVGLQRQGWEIFCVSVGRQEFQTWQDDFADDHCIAVAPDEERLEEQTAALIAWCEQMQPDIVIPMDSQPLLNALPSLPPSTRVVTRCAYTSPYGYELVMRHPEVVSHIVALTPDHVEGLVRLHGVSRDRITLIPNGVPVPPDFPHRPPPDGKLRLGYLGRLEPEKGTQHLPRIIAELNALAVPYTLQIGGAGTASQSLQQQLQTQLKSGDITFLGPIKRSEIPDFLARTDVLILPSQEEGMSFSLLEAMAYGCVPVANRIPGINAVITHGTTGLLCDPVGLDGFAQAIRRLHEDRLLLADMSRAAAEIIRSDFTLERMAQSYINLFEQVISRHSIVAQDRRR